MESEKEEITIEKKEEKNAPAIYRTIKLIFKQQY